MKTIVIPPLCLGTAGVNSYKVSSGSDPKFYAQAGDEEKNIEIILTWLEKSISAFGFAILDLAQVYGGGYTDIVVGRALQQLSTKVRNRLILLWKISRHTLENPDSIIPSVENALESLGVKTIDILMTHETPEMNLKAWMHKFEQLAKYGFIQSIGFGRANVPLLAQAKEEFPNLPVTAIENSASLHMPHKYIPEDLRTFCKLNGITMFAYRPYGGLSRSGEETRARVDQIAKTYGITPAQVAIAYSVDRSFVPIFSTKNPEHMDENIKAASIQLPPDILAFLEGSDIL